MGRRQMAGNGPAMRADLRQAVALVRADTTCSQAVAGLRLLGPLTSQKPLPKPVPAGVGSARGAGRLERGRIMRHGPWIAINANPGVAGAVLLVAFVGVMAWAWWPSGFLLP
jgi:hypothetical protein